MIRTAKISILSSNEGGRINSYAPSTISIVTGSNIKEQRLAINIDKVTITPGETAEIRIKPVNNKPFEFENKNFLIVEGRKIIAKGELIDLL